MPISWEELARTLGSLRAVGESGSSELARRAIEIVVGDEEWRRAVDHYVALLPGSELARSVLWLVRPWAGMWRCHELFLTSDDLEVRQTAVELVRVVADRRGLEWASLYLSDPDPGIQHCGAGLVDQLLWSELVEPGECEALLDSMERHANPGVREKREWIRSFLDARVERCAT